MDRTTQREMERWFRQNCPEFSWRYVRLVDWTRTYRDRVRDSIDAHGPHDHTTRHGVNHYRHARHMQMRHYYRCLDEAHGFDTDTVQLMMLELDEVPAHPFQTEAHAACLFYLGG